jgi:hypothetical protein
VLFIIGFNAINAHAQSYTVLDSWTKDIPSSSGLKKLTHYTKYRDKKDDMGGVAGGEESPTLRLLL